MRHGTGEGHLGGGLETARTGSRPSETAGTGSRSSAARPGRGEGKRARAAARRPRDAAATREALLAAGTELFAERGYDGVPVWSIARAAGVNKAMISYHFGGKRGLYRAILEATFAEIVDRVEALAADPRPAPELLRDLVAAVGDVATRRHPHFCTMMLREVLSGGRRLEPALVDRPIRVLAAVRRIVERGVAEGALRPVDPLLTHLSLVGSIVFFFATAAFRERILSGHPGLRRPDAGAYVKHVQDLIAHGLAVDRASARGSRRRATVSTLPAGRDQRDRAPTPAVPGRQEKAR